MRAYFLAAFFFIFFLAIGATSFGDDQTTRFTCQRQHGSTIKVAFRKGFPPVGEMKLNASVGTPNGYMPAATYNVIGFIHDGEVGVEMTADDVLAHFTFPDYVSQDYSFRVTMKLEDGRGSMTLSAAHESGSYFYFYHEPLECVPE